jgi:hypothetical protein
MPSGVLGQTPIDGLDFNTIDSLQKIYKVLHRAWEQGFTTKSKFARDQANLIAIAAGEGFITTRLGEEVWGNNWLLTDAGADFMVEIEYAFSGC